LDRFLDFSHHLAAAWRTLATEEGWNGLGLPCWLQHSGEIIQQDAFAHYVAHTWMHWLNGSHGVSLRGAEGPKDIAYKDHRVGVLRALHMGHRAGSLSQAEQNLWEQAARDYHRCVMDFSPHEVHLTSRHRFGL
jgi:hypothetical protein